MKTIFIDKLRDSFCKHQTAFIVILILFSLFIRLYKISEIPQTLNPDEGDLIKTFLRTLFLNSPGVFESNWNGAPNINSLIVGIPWLLLNKEFYAIKIASIIISTLIVILFFVVSKKFTKNSFLSFIIALVLSSNPWFLNFSRSGWENIFNGVPILLMSLGSYYIYRERNITKGIILLIISSIMGFYFYHPGKLLIPISLLILTVASIKNKPINFFKNLSVYSLITFIFILPQVLYMVKENGYRSFHRINSVSVINKENRNELIIENSKKAIFTYFTLSIKYFDSYLNHRYLPSNMNPIGLALTPFYIIGLLVSVLKFRYPLILYTISFFVLCILSLETPDGARLVHLVPMIFLFVSIGFSWMLETLNKDYFSKPLTLLFRTFLYILIIPMIIINLHTYFSWIEDPVTLEYRKPSVPKETYEEWVELTTNAIILEK